MAIAAAAAAARAPLPEVRMAYLLMAESWSDMAKAEEQEAPGAGEATVTPMENQSPTEARR
jgi:sirohydrochlorin ferrochelatase